MAQALPAFTFGNRPEESQEIMGKLSFDTFVRWLCGILFWVFAFCWLFFFQGDLIGAAISGLFPADSVFAAWVSHHHLVPCLVLTLIALLMALPGRILLRFRKGLYACNYLFSALFLAVITGYDGDSLLGQTYTEWIVAGLFMLILFLVCKVVASVPKSGYNDRSRTLAGNLLIMSLLFCLTGFLGNTDENLHRRLVMERLYSAGKYDKLLELGRYEEESDKTIDLLRAQAMLGIPFTGNPSGSMIGERLFDYSISDPVSLSSELADMGDTQAYLASCLLNGDFSSFRDSIRLQDYSVLPKYYMQALVLASDSAAMRLFPAQYKDEQSLLESFTERLESVSDQPLQYKANSTFVDYHSTYYWFRLFRTANHN